MDDNLRLILTYVLIPGLVGIGTYFMKNLLARIDEIEKTLTVKVDESKVRQVLEDKISPLREDIQEVKLQVQKIYDLLMHKR